MRHPRPTLAVLAATAAVFVAACGSGDDAGDTGGGANGAGDSKRTVDVRMVDIGYEPTQLQVVKGETVTFRFSNEGKLPHDAFIGDTDAQAEHEKEAGDMGGMHHGDDENAITVGPGKKGTITYTFDESGTTIVGCHQPGHYAAGMRIDVAVS